MDPSGSHPHLPTPVIALQSRTKSDSTASGAGFSLGQPHQAAFSMGCREYMGALMCTQPCPQKLARCASRLFGLLSPLLWQNSPQKDHSRGRLCFSSQLEGSSPSRWGRHSSRDIRQLVASHPQEGSRETSADAQPTRSFFPNPGPSPWLGTTHLIMIFLHQLTQYRKSAIDTPEDLSPRRF